MMICLANHSFGVDAEKFVARLQYEAQTSHPPAKLLPTIADALGLSVDQLLGRQVMRAKKAPTNERLLRQLRQVEKLPPHARRSVLEHIDGLVAKYGSRG